MKRLFQTLAEIIYFVVAVVLILILEALSWWQYKKTGRYINWD
jgi:hypothetical protein